MEDSFPVQFAFFIQIGADFRSKIPTDVVKMALR